MEENFQQIQIQVPQDQKSETQFNQNEPEQQKQVKQKQPTKQQQNQKQKQKQTQKNKDQASENKKIEPQYKKRSHDTNNNVHIPYLQENKPEIIFIGTSMFERFVYENSEAQKAFNEQKLNQFYIGNFGVGGDKISNIIYRLFDLNLLKNFQQPPKLIFLMAGANDIENLKLTPQAMQEAMQQIVNKIRQFFPDSQLYLLGMFPRFSEKIDEQIIYQRVIQYNYLLEKNTVGYDKFFWIGQQFLDFYDNQNINHQENQQQNKQQTLQEQHQEILKHECLKNKIGITKKHLFEDTVHLNYEGYTIFAKNLFTLINQYFERSYVDQEKASKGFQYYINEND
ncbi:hypothetical protein PPERSA_03377 [Pseudocohnilembus persalinus]|uniref:Uncharacterized protein n=1 Tax=Pseudocohnilembus persalinus TaxID=266149 RepID=A0A0V0R1I2_PSEPJ|nr:hypothetical protein PPERSA_03377 [Pseudocohnilembus persalinus]|eukprot:KRX08383.1 hypothetical protein PPERSA_03377 [Pseudocohnilembus persalinus]